MRGLVVAVLLAAAPSAKQLEGVWSSEGGCESAPDGQGGTMHFRRTFTFDKAGWKIDFSTYGDAQCSSAAQMVSVEIDGAYKVLGPSKNALGANEAVFGFAHRKATAKSDGAAGWLNSVKACGLSDWKAGQARDIDQSGCPQLGALPKAQCPNGEYDLLKLDGDKLFFGDRGDGNLCSEAKRPKQLGKVAVVKQH
ncbi:MAG: hypothetical protein QM723_11265 [Myxococcaceae bacterium]